MSKHREMNRGPEEEETEEEDRGGSSRAEEEEDFEEEAEQPDHSVRQRDYFDVPTVGLCLFFDIMQVDEYAQVYIRPEWISE